jgi:hypothetical protein
VIKTWLVSARLVAMISVMVAAAAGCRQDIGDRCQRNSDCASGICSDSIPQVCVANGSGSDVSPIDASLPADAPDAAAPVPDAAIDAPP